MNRIAKIEDEKVIEEMIGDYQTIINELGGLDEFMKSKDITKKLGINDRAWRTIVEDVMHLYMHNYTSQMIVGTNKGYILTDDTELIKKFIRAKEHQFKALAYNCYNLKKSLLHKNNYTINDFLEENLCN